MEKIDPFNTLDKTILFKPLETNAKPKMQSCQHVTSCLKFLNISLGKIEKFKMRNGETRYKFDNEEDASNN